MKELRILVNGVVVEQIADFNRTALTLGSLMPTTTKIMNGMEANILMLDPHGQQAPVARNPGGIATEIQEPRINCEKYEPLAAGEKRTISFSLAPSGVFQSAYLFPLMHGSISVEMLLVSSPKEVVVSDLAVAPGQGVAARRRSERWQINQPRLCYSTNTLSSAAQQEFDKLISGKGIIFNLDTITTLQQTCLSSAPRVQFFRSLNLLGEDRASEKLMCPSWVC